MQKLMFYITSLIICVCFGGGSIYLDNSLINIALSVAICGSMMYVNYLSLNSGKLV